MRGRKYGSMVGNVLMKKLRVVEFIKKREKKKKDHMKHPTRR